VGVEAEFVIVASALDVASGRVAVRIGCAVDPISVHDGQLYRGEFMNEDATFEIPVWAGGGGRRAIVANEARNTVHFACKRASARLCSDYHRVWHTTESCGIILVSWQTEVGGVGRLARQMASVGS